MNSEERIDWDTWATNLLPLISCRSEDPNTKVGCIILDEKHRVVSAGYNSLPTGLSKEEFSLERPEKYIHIVHADMNAILFAERSRLVNSTMYLPFLPCCECAKAIIQVGIKRVVYVDDYFIKDERGHQDVALKMLKSSNIIVDKYRKE